MFVKTMIITILLNLFQLWTWRRNVKRNILFFINLKNKTLFIVRHNINQIINIVFNKINKHFKIKMNAFNYIKINNLNFNSRHLNNNKMRQIRVFNFFDLIQILLKFHLKFIFHLNKKFISINKKRRIVNFEKFTLRMKRMKIWFQMRKKTIKKTKIKTLMRRKYLRQKTRITIKKTMKSKNLKWIINTMKKLNISQIHQLFKWKYIFVDVVNQNFILITNFIVICDNVKL